MTYLLNSSLSKSDYMMFLRHPALLWLKKHDPAKIAPIDEATQAMFDAGHDFEKYAEALFPSGTHIGFDNHDYKSMPYRTQQALDGGADVIFQGRFEYDRMTFICDVIQMVGKKALNLYEIKSSTGAKDDHIFDLAFQTMVLSELDYDVQKIAVIHVNNEYVKNGEIDPGQITRVVDVSDLVKGKLEVTRNYAKQALKTIDSLNCPDISPSHSRLKSFDEYMKTYRNLVDVPEYSIYDLVSMNAEKAGELEKINVRQIVDIPDDFKLSEKQRQQVEVTKSEVPIIHKEKIKKFLSDFEYPLYFLDYETMSSTVPYFDGVRPYQQLPFQYSLHVIDEPDGELRHLAYLHSNNSNPAEALSKSLQSHIGPTGSIVTWNMKFEKSCNNTLANLLPEYEQFYHDVNSRIVDLMIPFSSGLYTDKKFMGSASIKKVLPVLVPELSYDEMNIHEGDMAKRLWMQAVLDGGREDKQKILADLLEYCHLDTLAMVEIYKVLQKI